jgi:hypothetical protein
VNAFGEIIGLYTDATFHNHAFARFPGGAVVTIDVPTDLTGPSTVPAAINWAGQIVGTFSGSNSLEEFEVHGFVRDPIGRVTLLDVPGASRTEPTASNAEGWVAGTYMMPLTAEQHGFLQRPGHPLVTFDIPGIFAGTVIGIDATGRIFGAFGAETGAVHGYIRTLDGGFTTIDPPDIGGFPGVACPRCPGTYPRGSNALGRSVGIYGSSTAEHGYVRTAGGTFFDIDVPGASRTVPVAINLEGQVAGTYFGSDFLFHPFVMRPDGSFHSFDVFGSQSVGVTDINVQGYVLGYYEDANRHGFLYRM